MLNLLMRPGECLEIGDNVTLRIARSSDSRIQLEVDAPREVAIRRQKGEKRASTAKMNA